MKENQKTLEINTTIGVYASGDMKLNGVKKENLEQHIKYNIESRPGRALFVNGICKHIGNLSDEQVNFYERLFQSDSKYSRFKDSAPYH
jgi:hypothetical protein